MKRNAFTLIELAIVLTIVGLVIGGSFKLLKSSRQKAYINEAKEQVSIAKDAIIGDALEYGNLSSVPNFDQNLSPIKGKPSDNHKKFFYYPDNNLTKINSDICTFNKTNLQIKVMNGATLENNITNVAFVVAAQSANRNLQTGASTNGGITTVKVYRPSDKADDNSNDFTRAFDEFDDVVGWVTLNELQKDIDCSANKLVIVNDYSLPRDGNCTTKAGPAKGCYLGDNNISLVATGGYPYDDDSDENGFGDSDSDAKDDYLWCVEGDTRFDSNFAVECPSSTSIIRTPSNDCSSTNNFHQCTNPILDSKSSTLTNDVNLTAGAYSFTLFVNDKTKTISKVIYITIDNVH